MGKKRQNKYKNPMEFHRWSVSQLTNFRIRITLTITYLTHRNQRKCQQNQRKQQRELTRNTHLRYSGQGTDCLPCLVLVLTPLNLTLGNLAQPTPSPEKGLF